jgi:AcrR family transcriptional regulator
VASDPTAPTGYSGRLGALGEQALVRWLDAGGRAGEGLRERKKRFTRQLISDTATSMFFEQGFEAIRVADVAAACGVSEKTVYNYFPNKESLILDRFEDLEAGIRRALGPDAGHSSPVDAVVAVIATEVRRMLDSRGASERFDPKMIRRFMELVEGTPALRAAQQEMMDRMVQVAAGAMAARAGVNPDDPEPQIAANALLGLWRVLYRALARHADAGRSPAEVRDSVIADVRRAARLIDSGLWSFGVAVQGPAGREQVRLAAESANEARLQVLRAIRQARRAWRQVKAEADAKRHGEPRR